MKTPKEYLAQFPDERASTCFSKGSSNMYGREGSYYCANCDKWIGDVYREKDAPMQNESSAHCRRCWDANVMEVEDE